MKVVRKAMQRVKDSAVVDYVKYLVEEVRNSARDDAWDDAVIKPMETEQEGTREEREQARQRRQFWQNLKEGK